MNSTQKQNNLNILFVYSDNRYEWNCTQWRCIIPARALRKCTATTVSLVYIQNFIHPKETEINLCDKADIIIIQRNAFIPAAVQCVELMLKGKKIIIDIDDAYQYINKTHNAFSYWIEGIVHDDQNNTRVLQYSPLKQLEWTIKLVGNLSSPNQLILNDWSKLGINTILFPNYIESEKYKKYMNTEPKEIINLGWGGSLTHYLSFSESGVTTAITRILKRRKDVHLYLTTSDTRIVNAFDMTKGNVFWHNFGAFQQWPKLLKNTDIGIIPLHGNYDQRRSWIKPLECFCMGIPWLSSYSEAYKDIPGGKFVKNTANWWEEEIENAIDNYKTLKEQSISLAQDTSKFDVYDQAQNILTSISSVL